MMRVLFLTLYPPRAASPRYRVHQFLPHVHAAGIEAVVAPAISERRWLHAQQGTARAGRVWYHLEEGARRFRDALSARQYDIVFIQKAAATLYWRGLAPLIRRRSRLLVLDIDDAVHRFPPMQPRWPVRIMTEPAQVSRLMAQADLVLAGNRWLVREVEAAGGNAVHFPTVVDTDYWSPVHEAPNEVRCGWMGSPSTAPYLTLLGAGFIARTGIPLVCYGAREAPIAGAEVRPWRLETEVDDLRQCSLGVMPLPKTDWARGKCALKALQYMACGIPCIATPFGAVNAIITGGIDGCFADTPGRWADCAHELLDPKVRRTMGEQARDTVEARFSLRGAAPALSEHFTRLMDAAR